MSGRAKKKAARQVPEAPTPALHLVEPDEKRKVVRLKFIKAEVQLAAEDARGRLYKLVEAIANSSDSTPSEVSDEVFNLLRALTYVEQNIDALVHAYEHLGGDKALDAGNAPH